MTNRNRRMDVSLQIEQDDALSQRLFEYESKRRIHQTLLRRCPAYCQQNSNGFSQNLCDEANQIGDDIDPNYLEDRRDKQ